MESVASLLQPFLNGKAELLSISGTSASGKTKLALQLLCTILNPEKEHKVPLYDHKKHSEKSIYYY